MRDEAIEICDGIYDETPRGTRGLCRSGVRWQELLHREAGSATLQRYPVCVCRYVRHDGWSLLPDGDLDVGGLIDSYRTLRVARAVARMLFSGVPASEINTWVLHRGFGG